MKLLLDENLLPSFRNILLELGYEAQHVYDVNLSHTADEDIIAFARQSESTILKNDLDFFKMMNLAQIQFQSIFAHSDNSKNK